MDRLQFVLVRLRPTQFAFRSRARLEGDEGQAIVEYCLLLALITIVGITVVGAIAGHISTVFSSITLAL